MPFIENIKEEYSEYYFVHFMAMFNEQLTEEALKKHLHLANSIEGIEYIENMIQELKKIKSNNDQDYFIKFIRSVTDIELTGFNENHIEFLIKEGQLMLE